MNQLKKTKTKTKKINELGVLNPLLVVLTESPTQIDCGFVLFR